MSHGNGCCGGHPPTTRRATFGWAEAALETDAVTPVGADVRAARTIRMLGKEYLKDWLDRSIDPLDGLEIGRANVLHGTQAVAIRDQRVHAPSGKGRSRAKQHGERSTAGSRHQTTEGSPKSI